MLGLDDLLKAYKKSLCLNKNIKKEIGFETIAVYKRSSNILNTEEKYLLKLLVLQIQAYLKMIMRKNYIKK